MEGGVWVEGNLTMSRKEVDRVGVMQQVAERRILQQEAAARLGISVRQVKRLLARLRGEGPQGLVSRRRGRRPNNAFPQDLRQDILALVRGTLPKKRRLLHSKVFSTTTNITPTSAAMGLLNPV